jgi:hypothetical protein
MSELRRRPDGPAFLWAAFGGGVVGPDADGAGGNGRCGAGNDAPERYGVPGRWNTSVWDGNDFLAGVHHGRFQTGRGRKDERHAGSGWIVCDGPSSECRRDSSGQLLLGGVSTG